MSALLKIDTQDEATAGLRAIMDKLQDRAGLHRALAGRVADLMQEHIIFKAAPSRHTTALRLGANVTHYLTIAGRSITNEGTANEGLVTITQNGSIFARVGGPVNVRPREKKWLTIPNVAEAYGKKAEEIPGLRLAWIGIRRMVLVQGPKYAKKADGKRRTKEEATAYKAELKKQTRIIFWLKKQVTLPEDRGLLPTEAQFFAAMEEGVREAATFELSRP
jgi:hypothetical protein